MKAKLKGSNRIVLFRRAAERILSKLTAFGGVEAVLFLGGLTRGFVDKYSDVDMVVLVNRRDGRLCREIREIGIREQESSRIEVDLGIHSLDDFRKWRWREVDRWDFAHAEIVFDRRGEIRRILQNRLKAPKGFWTRRIVRYAEYMKWYCYPPSEGVGTIAEAWIDRGDLFSAHFCVGYAVDLLVNTIFALNREFLPPAKWRMFCFQDLKWLPRNHGLLREAAVVRGLTVEDFNRRLKTVRKVWEATLRKAEEVTGLSRDQMTRYYVERILCQAFAG